MYSSWLDSSTILHYIERVEYSTSYKRTSLLSRGVIAAKSFVAPAPGPAWHAIRVILIPVCGICDVYIRDYYSYNNLFFQSFKGWRYKAFLSHNY
jgi:hypothetical protein